VREHRRGVGTPLSLFSFQDVITCITGIMILLVLFLVLEVIMQKSLDVPAQRPQESAPLQNPRAVAELRDERAQLEGEIERAASQLAGQPHASPWQIRRDLEGSRAERERLARRKDELIKGIRQREDVTQTGEQDREEMERQVRELQERVEELKQLLAQLTSEDHVTFAFEETHKTPVIVQCSGDQIRAKPLSAQERMQAFPQQAGTSLTPGFMEWANQRDAEREGFFLVIRPSAAPYAGDLIRTLKDAGFDVGYEPLEESKTAVFGREPLP